MIFIEDSEKKSPLQKAGATNAFAHFHVPASRVRWWWRFNLESGGKTAALHILGQPIQELVPRAGER